MRKSIALVGCTAVLFAAVAARSTPVRAATADAKGTLAAIIVTAEKRSESVQTVPIAMTVLPAAELAREGVQNVSDLSSMSSTLEFTSLTANTPGTAAFIRGIGTETVGGSTTTGSVAMVLDGVTLGNTSVADLFDVNHVEILKGPQGTLFGSSVSAGVINVVTNAPDPSAMSSRVRVEYGSGSLGSQYSRTSVHAVTNLPLTAESALRIAVHSDHNNGVFNDVYTGAPSSEPDNGARIRYLIHASDALTVNFTYDYNKSSHDNYPAIVYRYAPTTPPYDSLSNALAQCGVTPGVSNFDYCSQYVESFSQVDRGAALQLDWKIGGNTLTSITADRSRWNGGRSDIQSIPLAITESAFAFGSHCLFFNCVPIYAILPGGTNGLQTQDRHQFSEEIRLASPSSAKLEWLVGLYYAHYKMFDDEPGLLTANFGGGTFTAPTGWWAGVHTDEYAGFGNVTVHLSDASRVIAGARVTHTVVDEARFDPPDTGNQNLYALNTGETKFTWRLGYQHDLNRDTMAYAMVSTGFKAQEIRDALSAGIVAAAAAAGTSPLVEVAPETPINYEIGIKESALDDRLAIDGDVFYEHVHNYQGQTCGANNQGTISCYAANVSHVDSKGVEVDVFGRPLQSMTLNFSGTYDDATYPPGFNGSDGVSLAGYQVEYAAKTKMTLSAEEALPISAEYKLVIGADVTYRSALRLYTQAQPWFQAPAMTLFNARIGIRTSKHWSVYLFGRNLGAKPFPRQIYPTPFQSGAPGQPGGLWSVLDAGSKRLVGLQLQAKF